ncbi:MAG: Holliday junction resolvase RecU [Erysipelotrichaceae bacterium]|nr:Holliday junction resolvase RecU [Erysipelotrichaceae bacterium]
MINYPNGKKISESNVTHHISASRRGMTLEADINQTNEYYLSTDKAVIHKKPTPVQIVHVDYPKRTAAKITEAYFKVPSTTDYNGIYRGKYIDFEAKETASKTSFPFSSIHPHQIEHLKKVLQHGAIGFFIIRFKAYDETFFVEASKIIPHYLDDQKRSLSYKWFKEEGILIPFGLSPSVHYLKVIDQLYFRRSV